MNSQYLTLSCPSNTITLDKLKIMGIVNLTSDSFSDGALYNSTEKAVEHSLQLKAAGAEIIDIGGESTRPGSNPISSEDELNKLLPVIKKLRNQLPTTVLSVDTYKAKTAIKCLEAGADIINDISSLRFDPEMPEVMKSFQDVPIVLMHIQGTPKDMQINPVYDDPVTDIIAFFIERIDFCLKIGISEERIILDPGIGFGKTFAHNINIIKRISEFLSLNRPILLGASRKSFLNHIYRSEPHQRIAGSLATTALALKNNVHLVRVHDVREHKQFIDTYYAIENG